MFFVRLETYCPSSFFQLSFTLVLLSKCLEKSAYTTHPFGTYSCFLASKMEHYSRSTLDHRAATVTRLPPRRWLSWKKRKSYDILSEVRSTRSMFSDYAVTCFTQWTTSPIRKSILRQIDQPFRTFAHCLKLLKMSNLNSLILAFSTNFCPIKSDLSGNTVWPQASDFQKLAKMDHFWHF